MTNLKLELRDAIYIGSLLVAGGVAYGKLTSLQEQVTDIQQDVRLIYNALLPAGGGRTVVSLCPPDATSYARPIAQGGR